MRPRMRLETMSDKILKLLISTIERREIISGLRLWVSTPGALLNGELVKEEQFIEQFQLHYPAYKLTQDGSRVRVEIEPPELWDADRRENTGTEEESKPPKFLHLEDVYVVQNSKAHRINPIRIRIDYCEAWGFAGTPGLELDALSAAENRSL